jgi:hypothetical protein
MALPKSPWVSFFETDGMHASAKVKTYGSVWWTGGIWGFIPGGRILPPYTSSFCWLFLDASYFIGQCSSPLHI